MGWLKNILWPQFRETIYEWQNDDTGQYAAALSFYTAFSFFPLLLVLLSGVGWFLSATDFAKQDNIEKVVYEAVQKNVGDVAAVQLNDILVMLSSQISQVKSKASIGGPTGFLMLLLGAIGIFAQIESAFARIWKEYLPQPKPGIWPLIQRLLLGRLKAFIVVVGLGTFIVLTFLSSFLLSGTATFLDNIEEIQLVHDTWEVMPQWFQEIPIGSWTLRVLQFGAGVTLNMLLFLFLYRLFCPRRIGWSACIRGSLVASLLWELGRIGLTWYLLRGGYTPYGVVGSFIAIMLWFFYAWNVMLFGAEWGEVYWRLRDHRYNRDKEQSETSSAVRPIDPLGKLPVLGTVATASNTPPGYEPISPKVDPADRPENR